MSIYVRNIFFLLAVFFTLNNYCHASEFSAHISHNNGDKIQKHDFEQLIIPIKVKNIGSIIWNSSADKGPIFVSYHLLSDDGTMLVYDNTRTHFPKEILPEETVAINLNVDPVSAGNYTIRIDLVSEGVTWFKDKGSNTVDIDLEIVKSSTQVTQPKYEFNKFNPELTWYLQDIPEISYCSMLANRTIRRNFNSWNFNSMLISGFSAGASYPQIWIRDSATIMPIARYLYSKTQLTSWIKAHLSVQAEDGSLQDWVAADGKFDKNTVESDQESSMIIAAHEISKSIGYNWLLEEVNSKSVLSRLSKALDFLFIHRLDAETGLIKSGHTADWGDVSDEFSDHRATDLHKTSNEVVGIYTNALAYGAAIKLSYLHKKQSNVKNKIYWENKANSLLEKIQKNLWQKNAGFFRTHKHVNIENHLGFDEYAMFPMGGNAVAVEMQVTNNQQTSSVINQAVIRQKLFNFSTISGVLLPPYPKDYFIHPALNDYYEYQNGGQWDWFGGRLVLQMFLHESHDALLKTKEICAKAKKNKGFFEWDSMDGKGNGSSYYTGSASVISRMIIEGLFGINWTTDKIIMKPRLRNVQGYIYLPQTAKNAFIAYSYEPSFSQDQEKYMIKFYFGTNSLLPKTLLIPNKYQNYRYKSVISTDNLNIDNTKDNMLSIIINEQNIKLIVEYIK